MTKRLVTSTHIINQTHFKFRLYLVTGTFVPVSWFIEIRTSLTVRVKGGEDKEIINEHESMIKIALKQVFTTNQ